MNTHATTAVLDMRQPLSDQHQRTLEETLTADAGVLAVSSPSHLPRLLMVAYSTTRTSSSSIAKRASRAGLQARIVGCA